MNKIYYIEIFLLLFLSRISLAQELKYLDVKDRQDTVFFGKYGVRVGTSAEIKLSKKEIMDIDSLSTNNDSIKVAGFEFALKGVMDAYSKIEGCKFPKQFYQYCEAKSGSEIFIWVFFYS